MKSANHNYPVSGMDIIAKTQHRLGARSTDVIISQALDGIPKRMTNIVSLLIKKNPF